MADALSRKAELASLKLEEMAACNSTVQGHHTQPHKGSLREGPCGKESYAASTRRKDTEGLDQGWALDHQREWPLRAQGWRLNEGDLKGVPCGWSPTEDTGPYIIARGDYWPKMEEEVSGYVRTCRLCQQDKVEQAKPAGWSPCLYQRDRASLSMD